MTTDRTDAGRALVAHRRTETLVCPECGRTVTVRVGSKTCGSSTCLSRRYRRIKRQEKQS